MLVESYRLNLALKVLAGQDGQDGHGPGNPEEASRTPPPPGVQIPHFREGVLFPEGRVPAKSAGAPPAGSRIKPPRPIARGVG
jgi:hypothetical protein